MKSLFISILLLISCLVIYAQDEPAKEIPEFEFLKTDGTFYNQNDIDSTRKTMIIFFDATCGHCKDAMKIVNKRLDELSKVNILLVSLDVEKSIRMFLEDNGPNLLDNSKITILIDTKYQFIPAFKPKKFPSLYLYDEDKKLLVYANNDKKIDKIFEIVAAENKVHLAY